MQLFAPNDHKSSFIHGRVVPGVFVALLAVVHGLALGQSVDWILQEGTSSSDQVESVTADGLGNVYVAGTTSGTFGASPHGGNDAFLRKYDATGNWVWNKLFGTDGSETGMDVSIDGDGNVFVTGYTTGDFEGANAGGADAYITKYSAEGLPIWTKQWGTPESEGGSAVATDNSGNAYVAGFTRGNMVDGAYIGGLDGFLSKFDPDGTLLWTEQWGDVHDDHVGGVAVDDLGFVYIAGSDEGDTYIDPGQESSAVVRKYDSAGNFLWDTHWGGEELSEGAADICVDDVGNFFITGGADGGGDQDMKPNAFTNKYASDGTMLWSRRIISPDSVSASGVSVDDQGNVYISGNTDTDLEGTNSGGFDGFVSKYDLSGTLLWTRQFGTDQRDYNKGVSVDGLGNIFFAGRTLGDLEGVNKGGYDIFVGKILDVTPNVLFGDFNGDGSVDAADYTVWRDHLGAADESSLMGNGNGMNGVDADDYMLWREHFGEVAANSGSLSNFAVPEPTCLALLTFASLTLPLARRPRR